MSTQISGLDISYLTEKIVYKMNVPAMLTIRHFTLYKLIPKSVCDKNNKNILKKTNHNYPIVGQTP